MSSNTCKYSYIEYLDLAEEKEVIEPPNIPGFEIISMIGEGGFGHVYKALDPRGELVALKVPTISLGSDEGEEGKVKLLEEIQIWEKLKHPHIVEFYSSSMEPMPHISMELMTGGSLEQLLEKYTLQVKDAFYIMEKILSALSHAHEMATVHRDIKPGNILFTSEGEPKITDWGIGKFMAAAGSQGNKNEIKVTLLYSAPEQYDHEKFGDVDWQTDIFQLGIVFYEMLTGSTPFLSQEPKEIIDKVLNLDIISPSNFNPMVPDELDRLVMAALTRDKAKRWKIDVMLFKLREIINKYLSVDLDDRCPFCMNELRFIEKYKRFYCDACQQYPRMEVDSTSLKDPGPPRIAVQESICPECSEFRNFIGKYGKWYCEWCEKYFD